MNSHQAALLSRSLCMLMLTSDRRAGSVVEGENGQPGSMLGLQHRL